MALPDRPTTLTPIESEWGQAVHDWTFAPKGADLHSDTTRTVSTTPGKLHLDIASEDPAGFLDAANDRVVMPAGSEGLYVIFLIMNSVNGTSGDEARVYLYLNGSSYVNTIEDSAGGVNVAVAISTLIPLTAGDIIEAYGQKKGSGTNPTVRVKSLRMIRVGNEYGA